MIMRRGTGFIVLAVSLVIGTSANAAQQSRRNSQQQEGPSYLPSAQSQPEFEAFTAVQNEANPATRITLGDTFLTTYPNSQLII